MKTIQDCLITLLTNWANIFKVKTVVTLAVVFVFCYMTVNEITVSAEFKMIATAIVTYYFAKPDNPNESGAYDTKREKGSNDEGKGE